MKELVTPLEKWNDLDESSIDKFILQTYGYLVKKLYISMAILKVDFLKSLYFFNRTRLFKRAIKILEYRRDLEIKGMFSYLESFGIGLKD